MQQEEAKSIQKPIMNEALLVAQYQALNTDIQRRLSDRFYLAFGALTVAATLLGISGIPGYVLLVYPWAGWLISLWILHNEISVKRKTIWMRRIEAAYVPGFSFLNEKPTSGPLSTDGLNIETIVNRMIAICQVGVSVYGVIRVVTSAPTLLDSITTVILALGAVVATVLTLRNDYVARRRRLEKKAQAKKGENA